MKVKIAVEVEKRAHKRILEEALAKPDIHAFVLCIGILGRLPSDRARVRVLTFVNDIFNDPNTQPRRLRVETQP